MSVYKTDGSVSFVCSYSRYLHGGLKASFEVMIAQDGISVCMILWRFRFFLAMGRQWYESSHSAGEIFTYKLRYRQKNCWKLGLKKRNAKSFELRSLQVIQVLQIPDINVCVSIAAFHWILIGGFHFNTSLFTVETPEWNLKGLQCFLNECELWMLLKVYVFCEIYVINFL